MENKIENEIVKEAREVLCSILKKNGINTAEYPENANDLSDMDFAAKYLIYGKIDFIDLWKNGVRNPDLVRIDKIYDAFNEWKDSKTQDNEKLLNVLYGIRSEIAYEE